MEICVNEQKALLDKCQFSNVKSSDDMNEKQIQSLVDKGILKIIVDKNGELRYSMKLEEKGYLYKSGYRSSIIDGFGTLQASIHNNGLANLNCYNVAEYRNRLEQIKDFISTKGIQIDISNPVLSKVEINKTFKIKEDMANYERVLDLQMSLLPAKSRLKVISAHSDINTKNIDKNTFIATTKKSGKSSKYKYQLDEKWYNKTKQLEDCYGIRLEEHYIRLEFTLFGTKKIKKELGTNLLNEITDDMINDWFDEKVKNWIQEPVENWKKEQKKKVLKIMKEYKEENGYRWVNKCITRIINEEIHTRTGHKPLILDIEEVIPLLNELYPNGNRRKKAKAEFRKIAKEVANNITNRDDLKLQELLEKLAIKE